MAATITAVVPATAHAKVPRADKRTVNPAAVTPGIPAWVWDEQVVLDAAADAIEPVLKADPHYTGVFVDARNRRLIGYATQPFQTALWSRARAAMPRGSALAYGTSMLTDRDVQDLTRYTSQRQRAGLPVTRWGLSALDGPFDVDLQTGHALPARDDAYLHRHGSRTLRVSHTAVVPTGRFNDTAPFYGGAYINGPLGTYLSSNAYLECTSGFMTRSMTNGSNYIITAAHCIKWADPREWTGAPNTTAFLGSATTQDSATDAAYVKTSSAVSATIYDGAYGNDYDVKPVAGAATNHSGDLACQSGATSRRVCTVEIYPLETLTAHNGYTNASYQVTEWAAYRTTSGEATAEGDSGGPVFSYINSNTQVLARGISSAGSDSTSCPSWVTAKCYHKMYFGDVNSMIKNRSLDITP